MIRRGAVPFFWICAVAAGLLGCGKSPESHLRDARDALFAGNPQEALREYRLALDAAARVDPEAAAAFRAQALRGAADIYYLELRDVRHAAEVYRELIKQYPDAPEAVDARLRLAELYRAYLKNGRAAVDLLTAVAQRRPTEAPRLTYEVAKIYFGLGDYGQAGFEAQKVVRQDGGTGLADDALLLTGQALAMVEGRRDEASAAFESLATRFADSDLRPHALFESGKMRAEAGDGEKAIELWVAALSSHPDPKLVQAYIERARRRIRNTTPRGRIGDEVSAFDRDLPRPPAPAPVRTRARNSVEAAGGSSEEAAHEHRGE